MDVVAVDGTLVTRQFGFLHEEIRAVQAF